MWEVGGIKIDSTRARKIVSPSGHGNLWKGDFLGKTLSPESFHWEISWGLVLTESLHPQDSENIVGLGNRAYGYKRLK